MSNWTLCNVPKALFFYEQVFRWYADGYRYPIMYRRIVSVSPKEDAATTSVTYLYSHQCKENLSVFEEKGIIQV